MSTEDLHDAPGPPAPQPQPQPQPQPLSHFLILYVAGRDPIAYKVSEATSVMVANYLYLGGSPEHINLQGQIVPAKKMECVSFHHESGLCVVRAESVQLVQVGPIQSPAVASVSTPIFEMPRAMQ